MQESHVSNSIVCHICDIVVNTELKLKNHIRVHKAKKEMECKICYIIVPDRSYNLHMKT